MKLTVILILVRTFGAVSKNLEKKLYEMEIKGESKPSRPQHC